MRIVPWSVTPLQKYTSEGHELSKNSSVPALSVIYVDEHIIVLDKQSGLLSVPGPRRRYSLLDAAALAFPGEDRNMDKMVVHRLDMDTSGVIVFARTEICMKKLNSDFRDGRIKKIYEALVCGSLKEGEGEIDLVLRRDWEKVPFMRVATANNTVMSNYDRLGNWTGELNRMGKERNLTGEGLKRWEKLINEKPKESKTGFSVVSRDVSGGYPVTRVHLYPLTGRTHQLRVHCAAIGHPILSDPIYGTSGEGTSNGGFSDIVMDHAFPNRPSHKAQVDLSSYVKKKGHARQQRLCLHAKKMFMEHPFTGAPMVFEAAVPF